MKAIHIITEIIVDENETKTRFKLLNLKSGAYTIASDARNVLIYVAVMTFICEQSGRWMTQARVRLKPMNQIYSSDIMELKFSELVWVLLGSFLRLLRNILRLTVYEIRKKKLEPETIFLFNKNLIIQITLWQKMNNSDLFTYLYRWNEIFHQSKWFHERIFFSQNNLSSNQKVFEKTFKLPCIVITQVTLGKIRLKM